MSTLEQRRDQMFPKLRPEEIDRLRRFGEIRRYAPGELLFVTGEPSPGMFVLIAGTVAVSARNGLGHVVPIHDPAFLSSGAGRAGNHSWGSFRCAASEASRFLAALARRSAPSRAMVRSAVRRSFRACFDDACFDDACFAAVMSGLPIVQWLRLSR